MTPPCLIAPAVSTSTARYLDLAAVCRLVGDMTGRRPSIPTAWRWCRRGIRGVTLAYIRVGRRIMVAPESLDRFFGATADADRTRPDSSAPTTPTTRTPERRAADVAAARRRLAERGIHQ